MSDLFYTGKAKRTSGGFSVACAGGNELVKRLRKLENSGKVAIERTVSDFASRAPGWVSKGIREHYGVDTAAIKNAAKKPKRGHTTIKVAGITVDEVTHEYKGRLLTPIHFKMSPKQRPDGRKRYKVKATIIKGQRHSLPSNTFLSPAAKRKEGEKPAPIIPWQRKGEGRLPAYPIRTLSVPQMIDGRAKETIDQTVSDELGKRFEHHIKQAIK